MSDLLPGEELSATSPSPSPSPPPSQPPPPPSPPSSSPRERSLLTHLAGHVSAEEIKQIARACAVYEITILRNPWIPDRIKMGVFPAQMKFLSFEGKEALYGGAAAGGKSAALLLAALQWVEQPNYRAMIMRRTFAMLSKADSIMNKSIEWITGQRDAQGRRAVWSSSNKKWTFPSGATIEFAHCEHEQSVFDLQGGAWHFIGVDESTQFTERMLSYPKTRIRKEKGDPIPLRWRGASNPGGVGHDVIKKRFVRDEDGRDPCDGVRRRFFPAKIKDNPHVDEAEYRRDLIESGIDPITLDQLLNGDWDAIAGGRFRQSDLRTYTMRGRYVQLPPLVPGDPPREYRWDNEPRFMVVDPAASSNQNADYTVCSTFQLSPWAELIWLGCDRFQAEIPEVPERIAAQQRRWNCAEIGIEAVGANAGVLQLAARCRDPILPVTQLRPGGRDKLVRSTTASALWRSGRVFLPATPHVHDQWTPWDDRIVFPLEDVKSELFRFTGIEGQDAHDDVVDTLSYGAEWAACAVPLGETETPGIITEADGMPGVLPY